MMGLTQAILGAVGNIYTPYNITTAATNAATNNYFSTEDSYRNYLYQMLQQQAQAASQLAHQGGGGQLQSPVGGPNDEFAWLRSRVDEICWRN